MESLIIKKPLISIITPVYNSSQFLDRCISSILNQTYKNIELILVNDGSEDNSSRICNDYAKLDTRIKVFHKGNGGVSSARNVGLENAFGYWLAFVDSDDFIDPDGLEHLIYLSTKYEHVDLIRSYHSVNDISINQSVNFFYKDPILYSRDEFLNANKIGGFISSLFVKREIVNDNNLKFSTDLKVKEDLVFTFKCVLNCNSILENHRPFYNCFMHEASATKIMSYDKVQNSLMAAKMVYEYALNYDNRIIQKSVKRYLNNGLQDFIIGISKVSTQNNKINSRLVRKTILNYLNECKLNIYNLNIRNSLFTFIILMDYRILRFIYKIFNK